MSSGSAAVIQYGNNPKAGKYVEAGDAKLYYEVYGKGEPIVMLYGGVFGYISEFSELITDLSANYQVTVLLHVGMANLRSVLRHSLTNNGQKTPQRSFEAS